MSLKQENECWKRTTSTMGTALARAPRALCLSSFPGGLGLPEALPPLAPHQSAAALACGVSGAAAAGQIIQ